MEEGEGKILRCFMADKSKIYESMTLAEENEMHIGDALRLNHKSVFGL